MTGKYQSTKAANPEKAKNESDKDSFDKSKLQPKEKSELENIKNREKEAKEATTEKTSGIKREVLESEIIGTDKETVELIASIDSGKKTIEQSKAWSRLELANATLMAKLFDKGYKLEVLQVLESFRSIEIPDGIELNGSEKIALKKIKEIASQTTSTLFTELTAPLSPERPETKWSEIIKGTRSTYERCAKTRNALFGGDKGKTSKEKPTKENETGLTGFIKKHPIASAAILTAGAYGIYKIFFAGEKKEGTDSSGKSSSWLEKIKSKPAGIVLGLLVLGGLIGPKKIAEWLGNGFDFTKEKIERFVQLLSDGKYKEAFLSLFEGNDDNMENYKKLAEIISKETGTQVTDSAIKSIANAKYSIFMSVVGRSKTFASTWVKEIPGLGSTLASFVLDSKEQAAQEDAIRKYFEKKKAKIDKLGLPPTATVLEVMTKMNDLSIVTPGESAEDKEKGPVTEIIEAGTEKVDEVLAISGETYEQLKQEFKDKPNFLALLNKYGNNKLGILSRQFADDLATAVDKDGLDMLIGGGKILIWNGYKFITITSIKTIANTVWSVIKGPEEGERRWKNGLSEYTKGAVVFAFFGSVGGSAWAALTHQNIGLGFLRGGGKGFAYPVTVANAHYRFGQWVYRTAQGEILAVKARTAAAEARPKLLEAEAKYYADLFDKYDKLENMGDQGAFYDPRKYYAQLSKRRISKIKLSFLNKFAKVFNHKDFPGGRLLPTKTANDITNSEITLRKWLSEKKGIPQTPDTTKPGATETAAATATNDPVLQKSEGSGPDAKHTYKYHNQEVVLTEKQIAEKAREIAQEERAANNIPKAGEETAWNDANWKKAINTLAEEKILTPVEIKGKANTFKFAGQEVVITPEELKIKIAAGLTESEALKATCMEKAIAHVTVEEVRIVKGVHEYKIGGKWISAEVPTEASKLAEVKEAFVKHCKEKGTAHDFEKFAREAKSLKYLPVLEKTIGLAAAVGVIYHLETAPDKRKAVAEISAGFGSAWAGMKLTDWAIGSKLNPGARTVVDIMGGIAAACGLTEPISKIVTSVFETIPGSYGVGGEVADIFEKMAYRSTMRLVFASAEKGILKKLVMKVGLDSVGAMFEKKIGGVFMKKIGQLAAKQGFKQVLKTLGWKGVTTAALLADDATVIGVLDDVIAIGLIIWMGSDIYDMVKLIANAVEINSEMEKRSASRITSFEIKDGASRTAFQEKLTPFGLTVERAHELGEQAVFDILKTLPETEVGIKREGIPGREIWTLNKGEAVGIAIQDDMGRIKCQISGQDANTLDKALDSVKVKEEKA